MGTSLDAYELNHECASTSDLITPTRTSTRVQMFYLDSNTTVPLQCVALVFLDSVC